MVPNTPITPVHQLSTSPPPPRSTSPVHITSQHPPTPTPPPFAPTTPSQCPSPPPRRRSSATAYSPTNLLASVMSRGRKGSLQQVAPVSSAAVLCQSGHHHHHNHHQHHQCHAKESSPPLSPSSNSGKFISLALYQFSLSLFFLIRAVSFYIDHAIFFFVWQFLYPFIILVGIVKYCISVQHHSCLVSHYSS